MRPIVQSIKHYVHFTNTAIASGAIRSNVIVDSQKAPASTNAQDVKEGSIVKAVYVEQWIKSSAAAGTDTQFAMVVEKVPINAASVSAAGILNLGAYVNKKNILYTTQGVIGDLTTQGVPVHRGWIKIPKGKQRMGLSDRIVCTVAAVGDALQNCGISTYKEYI